MKTTKFIIIACLMLFLCNIIPLSVGAQEAANDMLIGTTVNGVHSDSDRVSYNFTLTEPGMVTITFCAETDINEGRCYYGIYGVGLVGYTIYSWSSLNGKFSVKETKYLESGDYSFSCSYGGNGIYTIESTFEPAKSSFDDPNGTNGHTIDTANEINLSETYYGLMMDGDDKDLYRFTLTKNSTVNMSFNCHTVKGWFYYAIYDEELNLIKSRQLDYLNTSWGTGSSQSYFDELSLDAGDYYLQITTGTGGGTYDFAFHCAHNWDDGLVTKESTCSEVGVKTFTCSSCNANKTEEIPKLSEHDFGAWTTVDGGSHERVCAICQEKESSAHNWNVGIETKHPTHTDYGEMTYTCSDCGETKTDKIDKLASHSYGDWIKVDGSTHKRTCTCGEVETENHIFGEWIVTKETTEMEKGSKTKTCACGYMITEDIPVLDDTTDFPEGSDLVPEPTINNHGHSNGVITGIIIGSLAIFSGSGLSVYWFVIKKKTWTDLLHAFKSQDK